MQQTAKKQYEIQYPLSAYTFPTQARAERVTFDDTYLILHLRDGRVVMVPLTWIPTLYHASPADREKFFIASDGMSLHWDPDQGSINEDLLIASFMRYDERP